MAQSWYMIDEAWEMWNNIDRPIQRPTQSEASIDYTYVSESVFVLAMIASEPEPPPPPSYSNPQPPESVRVKFL